MIARALALLALLALLACCAACPPPAPPPSPSALQPFPVGSVPNDIALSTCDGAPVALVTASGDARLDVHSLPGGAVVGGAFLGQGSSPWSVDVAGGAGRALVTLFADDTIALVDVCGAGGVLDTLTVDGAITPQGVVLAGAGALGFVSFTNIEAFSVPPENAPPVVGAGRVVALSLEGDALALAGDVELPCKNPQGLALVDAPAAAGEGGARLLASCSAPLMAGNDGGQVAIEDGGIVIIDAAADGTLAIVGTVSAARLAPGTPAAFLGGTRVVAGSLVDPLLLHGSIEDGAALEVALELDGPDADALFEVVRWDDDTALVVQFSQDAIHVVDVAPAALTIVDTIRIGPGGAAFRGALALDVDRTVPAGAVDAVALLGLSAEAVPLKLAELIDIDE